MYYWKLNNYTEKLKNYVNMILIMKNFIKFFKRLQILMRNILKNQNLTLSEMNGILKIHFQPHMLKKIHFLKKKSFVGLNMNLNLSDKI